MNPPTRFSLVLMTVLLGLVGSGCLNLKPVEDQIRYFVLSSMDRTGDPVYPDTSNVAIGLEPVIVAPYLTRPWVVQRTGENELMYSDFYKWSETMDRGIQKVMVDNLGQLLGTDRILVSAWRRDAVHYEVRLVILQFDVDTDGKTVLEAQWTIEGNQPIAGQQSIVKHGPSVASDPAGAAATMSAALADLSRAIASDIAADHKTAK